MNVTINKNHLVYENELGSYHVTPELLLEKGNKLEEYVIAEINKKLNSKHVAATINFDQARELGFCEYGIKDFCKMLDLNIDSDHSLLEVKEKLTLKAFTSYSSECIKLFGKDVIENFGGASGFLTENKMSSSLNLVLENYVKDVDLHRLSCDFALNVIDNFEKDYPNDNHPRLAIETKLKWLNGDASDAELKDANYAAYSAAHRTTSDAAYNAAISAANSAANDAANSAAWSAAWSDARSAANSAANDAAYSAASAAHSAVISAAYSAADRSANSAAYSAADRSANSAAYSAELEYQIDKVLIVLNKGGK